MIYCIIAGAEDEDLGKVVQELEAENKRLKLTIDGMCEIFFGYTETVVQLCLVLILLIFSIC